MAQTIYIVFHIYKTAGQSLRSNFEKNFRDDEWLPMYAYPIGLDKAMSPANPGWDAERVYDYVAKRATSRTRCIFGHMAYFGVHNLVDSDVDPLYITFLRDPVERIISFYYHLRNQSPNVWGGEIVERNWSIEEWLDKSRLLAKCNGQLRQLLLGTYDEVLTERELTREHLEEGKRRLREFWYVGLTETFREDSHYLYGKLGFSRFHPQAVVNPTPDKKEVSPKTREYIAERNALDIELYQFAKKLRAEFINHNAFDYHFNKNKAIIMKSAYFSVIAPAYRTRRLLRGWIRRRMSLS